MKIAISLPDELFEATHREAKKRGVTRSGLVQEALRQFLQKEREKRITESINESIALYGDPSEEFAPLHDAALREILANSEWEK